MPPREPLTHPQDGWPCLLYSAWLELVNSRATLQTDLIILSTNIEERRVIHSAPKYVVCRRLRPIGQKPHYIGWYQLVGGGICFISNQTEWSVEVSGCWLSRVIAKKSFDFQNIIPILEVNPLENNIFRLWGLRILIELLLQFSRCFWEHRYAHLNLRSDEELNMMQGITHKHISLIKLQTTELENVVSKNIQEKVFSSPSEKFVLKIPPP